MKIDQPLESQFQNASLCQFVTIDWIEGYMEYGYSYDDPKELAGDFMLDNRRWLKCNHLRQYIMLRHD